MTVEEFKLSAQGEATPPPSLTPEAMALWHAKKGNWEAAHNIAQDIHTPMGSWIHALLHVIEGDQWNADYWFRKAKKPSRKPAQIDALWDEIADTVLST
ncbi:MAG: hypothetical protein KDK97_10160 [Verrucomicrobiales bacterium]|nr:hypothetical protein [Verrucomicrobiales bacterium]